MNHINYTSLHVAFCGVASHIAASATYLPLHKSPIPGDSHTVFAITVLTRTHIATPAISPRAIQLLPIAGKMARTDLSPVTLLQQEIQTLTSSMRRNQRWASTSTSSFQASNAPLPPAFHPKSGKRSRESSTASRRGRQSGEGVDEGDLMVGFIELRRTLAGVKGEC